MQRIMVILLAAGWGIGLLVLGLWTWQHGPMVVQYLGAHRPPIATWATRSAAIAQVAGGEALLTLFAVGNLWERRDAVTRVLGVGATAVFLLGGATAVALGVACR